MRVDDLALLRTPSSPTLSPDGQRVVVAVTRLDLEADAYRSGLWTVPTDASAPPRPLTYGPRDSAPLFSPDGRWLAFLRAGDDSPPQLHVMAADGGEPRQVCAHPLGVSGLAWHPSSTRIAYEAPVPEQGRYGTDEEVQPEAEPPRRITTLKYRLDGVGYTIDRRSHVFHVDVVDEQAEPEQLTDGDWDDTGPTWSPDGRSIAFVSARHRTRDDDMAADVFLAPAAGGTAPVRLTDGSQPIRPALAFSPDGATLYYTGIADTDAVGRNLGIYAVRTDGSGSARRLTDEERWDVGNGLEASSSPLLAGEDAVLAAAPAQGAIGLYAFPVDGGLPQPVLAGARQVTGHARAGQVLVAVVADATSAGEVLVLRDGSEKVLTDFGERLTQAASLRPMEELAAVAPDGYPVHGWLITPAGQGPFPTVLAVHGGPHAQYGYTLFDEAQVHAGAGYAVVLGNPRGAAGYGQAHGRAVVGDFGGIDHADLTALLDAALQDRRLDAGWVGVMGGSYGGFMTTWMIAHSDRFTAAVTERALNAPDSFAATSDIGAAFVDLYLGTELERQSPLTQAHRIRTPTLIIHSEHDWRCPLEQAQRLYVALKRNGVETEMLLFPGEGHELSRGGLPSHRVARLNAILDWWSRQHL